MGDHDGSAALQQGFQVVLKGGFSGGIEEGGGLIHHQHRGFADRYPRHRQQLPLARGKVGSPLAQFGGQSRLEPSEQGLETQLAAEALQLGVAEIGIEAQVVGHIAAEQKGVLQHHPEAAPQQGHRQLPDVHPIEQDPAGLGLVEATEQANDRGLAGAGGPHDRHMFSRGDAEGEVFEDRIVAAVSEAHVLEHHLAGSGGGPLLHRPPSQRTPLGRWQVGDLDRLLQEFADPLHGRQPSLDLGEPLCQLAQWIKEALGEEDEGGEGAQPHGAGGDHRAPEGQHHGHRRQGHPLDEGGDGAVVEDRASHRIAVEGGGLGEAGTVHRLAPEHLHHLKALQVFLEIGIELAEFLAHPVVGAAVAALQPENPSGDGNLNHQQQQSQPPFDHHHRDRDHQQAHQVGEHPHRPAAEHLGQRIHIAGEAGEQLAHRGAVVEAQRQAQGMAEEIGPDPGGEPLTHHLHVEALGALESQAQQHRHKEQAHKKPQGHRHRQGRQPGEAGFLAQHADRLPHQQGLYRSGQGQGDEQQQREQQAATVAA